ncbi:MAG: IS4 family transposase, partial [Candidatus Igneacidithiobacillus chanchocoensis]
AKLGGFLGRKSDGEPGVKVLWRGFRRLQDLTAMREILRPPPTYG